MATLVLGTPPPELEALRARRRRADADRGDEVWEGVYHMAPAPSDAHAQTVAQLLALLHRPATDAGLRILDQFNLGGSEDDYRVPDGGLRRRGAGETWHLTAALVIEVVSPGDKTWDKLSFYTRHNVDEILIVDPTEQTVIWLALREGEYRPVKRSGLVELGTAELAEQLDWP